MDIKTAYCFLNCEPTHGYTIQKDKQKKQIEKIKSKRADGFCNMERSTISADYARNFICDHLIGKVQKNSMLQLF